MKPFGLTLRIAGATVVLVALQALWTRPRSLADFRLFVLPCLLVVLALGLVAACSRQQGWKLSATIFVLYFGINQLNTLDEVLLFHVGPNAPQVLRWMASGFLTALVFSPLLVLILGRWNTGPTEKVGVLMPRSAANWLGRVLLSDVLYVICYFVAGIIAFPFVKDFYAGTQLPGPATILEVEVFRGFVYVAAGLAVVHGMQGRGRRAAASLGLSFPILAGVAPLLLPNAYLPGYVRLAHGFEIGISNIVYGILLGYVLTRKEGPQMDEEQAQSAEVIL